MIHVTEDSTKKNRSFCFSGDSDARKLALGLSLSCSNNKDFYCHKRRLRRFTHHVGKVASSLKSYLFITVSTSFSAPRTSQRLCFVRGFHFIAECVIDMQGDESDCGQLAIL